MAAATKVLARSQGCVAILNYDDVTLLATGVTIANVSGVETIVFSVVLNSTTISRTVLKGQTGILNFPSSAQASVGTAMNGSPSFVIAGLPSIGVGSV